jgi:hypothetical protein
VRPSISGAQLISRETTAPGETAPPVHLTGVLSSGKAPDFTVDGADGKPLKLSDFKGKVVILDLWAVGAKYNVMGIPSQFVISPDGTILGGSTGYEEDQHSVKESLRKAGIAVKP